MSNSTFSGNGGTQAGTPSSWGGGGIDNEGTLTVSFSTFSGNSAYNNYGGGIDNGGTLTLKGTFTGE